MPFVKLILCMMSKIKESTQVALERFFEWQGKEEGSKSPSAFSQARQKVRWKALRELFDLTVRGTYSLLGKGMKRWRGFRLLAVEGSVFSLPVNEEMRKHIGTTGPGEKSPAARGSILYDILMM
jgi:hypothetical protein